MKILFLSHEISRTGAPLYLYHLLKWMKQRKPNLEFDLLVEEQKHKELYNDFSSICKVTIYKKLGFYKRLKLIRRSIPEYELIYANSIASSSLLEKISKGINSPVICHVHESSDVMNNRRIDSMEKIIKTADYYVAVSKSVYEGIKGFGIEQEKIRLIHNFLIPFTTIKNYHTRKQLNIPNDAFVVGTLTANADCNKAPKRAIEVAKMITNKNIYFVFSGLDKNNRKHSLIRSDLSEHGLEKNFIFINPVDNPIDYIKMFDMYFISSIVESFSLTMLEAGAMKTPVLSFDDNEGPCDILHNDVTGLLVGSTKEAAEVIERSVTDTARLERISDNFYREIRRHFEINHIGEKVYDVILDIASGKPVNRWRDTR